LGSEYKRKRKEKFPEKYDEAAGSLRTVRYRTFNRCGQMGLLMFNFSTHFTPAKTPNILCGAESKEKYRKSHFYSRLVDLADLLITMQS
jgi:hypothetical protein